MASTTAVVQHARLRMRPLQSWYQDSFEPLVDPPSKLLLVTQELVEQLAWWSLHSNLLVGCPFGPLQPSIQLTMDANLSGWGVHCLNLTANGHWTLPEAALHINALELLAVFKALRASERLLSNKVVQVTSDNTTVVYYPNKQGGTHSRQLLHLTVQIWDWCCAHHIFLVAVHVASVDNVLADRLSSSPETSHEWALDQAVFSSICQRWGIPCLDLFASAVNAKCDRYCSRAGMGSHSEGDAFMVSWTTGLVYVFPPIPLIQKTVIKIHQDRANVIFIAPWWPRQPWFAPLLQMASDHFRLPSLPHLLSLHEGRTFHPDLDSLHLTAWRLDLR
uniref:Uncharacterized protein isoform X1 n=1 Tax=Pogona vitticeps TaxID=103695 RepID=A0ABM5FT66_9SAUR